MKTHQKGFIAIIVIVIIALAIGAGTMYFFTKEKKSSEIPVESTFTLDTNTKADIQVSKPSTSSEGSINKNLTDSVFISATKDPQAKVMAHGDINGDGYSDAILMSTHCGASCSNELLVVLNKNNMSAAVAQTDAFAPAYKSSSAAKSALSYISILDNGTVTLTGSGLECTPPGSEEPCTQEKWSVEKTIKYRFEGGKMVQVE